MKLLLDTNILIDILQKRRSFYNFSAIVVSACQNSVVSGSMSAQSISDIFYILRKELSYSERKLLIKKLSDNIEILAIDKEKITNALNNDDFVDFEDCLQSECAAEFQADYIITRNIKHFTHSLVPAITPEDFCRKFLYDSEQNI